MIKITRSNHLHGEQNSTHKHCMRQQNLFSNWQSTVCGNIQQYSLISFCTWFHNKLHLIPPATKLEQGYIFTGVCNSVQRGSGVYASVHAGILHPPSQDQAGTSPPPPEQSILWDTVNERAVSILLECNLVINILYFEHRITLRGLSLILSLFIQHVKFIFDFYWQN